jgi:hypothetical protein
MIVVTSDLSIALICSIKASHLRNNASNNCSLIFSNSLCCLSAFSSSLDRYHTITMSIIRFEEQEDGEGV